MHIVILIAALIVFSPVIALICGAMHMAENIAHFYNNFGTIMRRLPIRIVKGLFDIAIFVAFYCLFDVLGYIRHF